METERLILRRAELRDVEDYYAIRNEEFVLKYNCMKKLDMLETTKQVCENALSDDVFHIELKGTGKMIGMVGIEEDLLRYQVKSLIISYFLGEQYANQGYMTEALEAVKKHIFEVRGAEVMVARVFHGNDASVALLKKLGFTQEGRVRNCVRGYGDILYDGLIFSLLREEYLTNRPA